MIRPEVPSNRNLFGVGKQHGKGVKLIGAQPQPPNAQVTQRRRRPAYGRENCPAMSTPIATFAKLMALIREQIAVACTGAFVATLNCNFEDRRRDAAAEG